LLLAKPRCAVGLRLLDRTIDGGSSEQEQAQPGEPLKVSVEGQQG
jgi:hypothetical protein